MGDGSALSVFAFCHLHFHELMRLPGIVLLGLVPLLWFGALHQALYDYWAMTLGVRMDQRLWPFSSSRRRAGKIKPLKFPLLTSWTFFVAAAWLSVLHSFDVTTSLWEAWGWTYCMVVFYIVVNAGAAARGRTAPFSCGRGKRPRSCSVLAALRQQMYGSPLNYGAIVFHGRTLWRYGHWEIHAALINSAVLAGFLLSWSCTFWPFPSSGGRVLTGFSSFILVVRHLCCRVPGPRASV